MPLLADGQSDEEPRVSVSQIIDTLGGRGTPENPTYGVMVREGRWKFVLYHKSPDTAMLFDLEADPRETTNVIADYPEVSDRLDALARSFANARTAEAEHTDRLRMTKWLRAYEAAAGAVDAERWKDNPPTARGQLAVE